MENYEKIKKMSKDDVIKKFNNIASSTSPGAGFWRQEIFYKESEKLNGELKRNNNIMLWLTISIFLLTFFIAILTCVMTFK